MQYINYTGDIGADINRELTRFPMGEKFILPIGTLHCATKINLDLIEGNGVCMIEGHGMGRGFVDGGTLIDATGLADDVFSAVNSHLGGFYLSDFAVRGGNTGFKIHNCSGVYRNLAASQCAVDGFNFYRCHRASLGHLYAKACQDAGIKLTQMSAAHIDKLIARENHGQWAVKILGGSGFRIGSLYIESNKQGALLFDLDGTDPIRAASIGAIYLENNNVLNTADYAIFFNSANALSIDSIYLMSNTEPVLSMIGFGLVNSLSLGYHSQNPHKIFSCTDHTIEVLLRNISQWSASAGVWDFSRATDSSRVQVLNLGGTPQIIDPKNVVEYL